MSIRDDALADILAATSTDVLGQSILIDNTPVDAVVKSLTTEEVNAFGFDGVSMEGLRLTYDASALSYIPVFGQQLDIDGVSWDVKKVNKNGDRLRVTLIRYVS